MAANGFLRNGYVQNEHLFLTAQQSLVYERFLVILQI